MAASNENFERKISQMFVKFSFICLNNLKSVERRKSNFLFKYINFAAFWILPPVATAPPVAVPLVLCDPAFFFSL
jgi:hypothetical protein